jgi:hypothetical protein
LQDFDYTWYGLEPEAASSGRTQNYTDRAYQDWKDHAVSRMDGCDKFDELQEMFMAVWNTGISTLMGTRGDCATRKIAPGHAVIERFMKARKKTGLQPRLAFHGTAADNRPSIYKRGLLVPGSRLGQDITVAHGSASGVGIYTAKDPWLSEGFTNDNRVIACAVLDTAAPKHERFISTREEDNSSNYNREGKSQADIKKAKRRQEQRHRLQALTTRPKASQKQHKIASTATISPRGAAWTRHFGGPSWHSKSVRHAGSAMVIFDEALVIPMFLVDYNDVTRANVHNLNKAIATSGAGNPNLKGQTAVGIGLNLTQKGRDAVRFQRKMKAKARDNSRRISRNSKHETLAGLG